MLRPNKEEKRILAAFFKTAGAHLGLANKDGVESNELYQGNLKCLRKLMSNGLPGDAIIRHCRLTSTNGAKTTWITEAVPDYVKDADSMDRNILTPGVKPIHRLVTRVTMPVSYVGLGQEVESNGDIEISYADSFTMEELLDYFFSTFQIDNTAGRKKSAVGAFNYLLSIYNLDSILFGIDFAKDSGKYVKDPLQLKDFVDEAEEHLKLRRIRA